MSEPPTLSPGTVFARDFKIVRKLAQGGMGAIYVVDQLSTGKQRALKTLLPALLYDDPSRERFQKEARVAATVESDHIVEVMGSGIDEASQTPWLLMEMLHGETLADRIMERGPLTLSESRSFFEQLGHALASAHEVGLVHRDLKPENIFLATPRRRGVPFTVKVLDFGIAKVVPGNRTSVTATSALGSPVWMAPEQADEHGAIRPSTDVWAIGLIAFYLLTGKRYWLELQDKYVPMSALVREILLDPIAPPSERAAQLGAPGVIPRGFDRWFLRCVDRVPANRYPAGGAAIADLEAILAAAEGYASAMSAASAWSPPSAPGTTPASAMHSHATAGPSTDAATGNLRLGVVPGVPTLPLGSGAPSSQPRPGPPQTMAMQAAPPSIARTMETPAAAWTGLHAPSTGVPPAPPSFAPPVNSGFAPRSAPGAAPVRKKRSVWLWVGLGVLVLGGAGAGIAAALGAFDYDDLPRRSRRPTTRAGAGDNTATTENAAPSVPPEAPAVPAPQVAPPVPVAPVAAAPAPCPDGMVQLPGGTFNMGTTLGGGDSEHPSHPVTVAPFCIDRAETTVAQYRACVRAGQCTPSVGSGDCNYAQSSRENHPINCVDWSQAERFCAAKNARLPTEAEWEFAARGAQPRRYPWGQADPDATRVNGCGEGCIGDRSDPDSAPDPPYDPDDAYDGTAPVGSFPAGATPEGIVDLAGNVWEWTADLYAVYPGNDGLVLPSDAVGARVRRGASFGDANRGMFRGAARGYAQPTLHTARQGFRCAR